MIVLPIPSGQGTNSASDVTNILYPVDLETIGNVSYMGKLKKNGVYQIIKTIDSTGDLAISYAGIKNNPTKADYAAAWAARASLVFGKITEI